MQSGLWSKNGAGRKDRYGRAVSRMKINLIETPGEPEKVQTVACSQISVMHILHAHPRSASASTVPSKLEM